MVSKIKLYMVSRITAVSRGKNGLTVASCWGSCGFLQLHTTSKK